MDISEEPTLIAIDLETTDLIRDGQMPHITQIAAKAINNEMTFNVYVRPKLPIASGAQQISGITMSNDEMFVSGTKVTTTDIHTAVNELLSWLEKFPNVILIAHYGKGFDFPVLLTAISNTHAYDRLSCVKALLDSIELLRNLFPGRASYKQPDLVLGLLDITYQAHNALEDVIALGKLIVYCNKPANELMKFSFPLAEVSI